MEDLILTPREHKILKKFQEHLQKCFNVIIQMPKLGSSVESDIIFASINGESRSRERVKKFLSEKVNRTTEKVEYKKDILLITLSDSEEEPIIDLKPEEDSVCIVEEDVCHNSTNLVDELITNKPLDASASIIETPVVLKCSSKHSRNYVNDQNDCKEQKYNPLDNFVSIIESPVITDSSSRLCESITNENFSKNKRERGNIKRKRKIKAIGILDCKEQKYNPLDNSVSIIESPVITDSSSRLCESVTNENFSKNKRECGNSKRKRKIKSKGTLPSSHHFEDVESCEVSSTTEESLPKKMKLSKKARTLTQEFAGFIPLDEEKQSSLKEVESSSCSNGSFSQEKENEVIIIDNPLPPVRSLRPVVIDGSNVAIEHGKVSQTFSAKGISIAVDYFLSRGHKQVTAFVPRFRRFCNRKNFPTTDPEILDQLAEKQHVVFTPSRRLNGKCIASYDDRFIVQLASTNGGVIVSNDNYRDLLSENDSFKEVIENRLLMFCFVGDIFMIPSDPLGRNGPSLSDFLSFPPNGETL